MLRIPFCAALTACVGSTSIARATDWTVDDSGGTGVDFTTIQAAVDAAQSGDHVIVRDGTYAGFVVSGKGLVVAESPGQTVSITGPVRVLLTPAGTGVQLSDLTIDLSATPGALPLEVASNAGSVIVSRCVLRGFDGPAPTDAARVLASARVFLLDCELAGGDAPLTNSLTQGGHGLRVSGSVVEVHRSTLSGGRGGSDFDGSDQDDLYSGEVGGAGMSLDSSSALSERSTYTGGRGGNSSSDFLDTRCPGGGGSGVLAWTGSTFAHYLSTLTGAPAGVDQGTGSCTAPAGLPVQPPAAATEAGRVPICLGTYDRCPCGNEGDGGNGCDNSFANGGARLDVSGATNIPGDTLTLTISGIGAMAPALYFQGSAAAGGGFGTAFGDGIRCAGGSVVRLGSRRASGGTASLGFAVGDPPISTTGQVPGPGATRLYQVWYRNSAVFCTTSAFNLTNGYEIRWGS